MEIVINNAATELVHRATSWGEFSRIMTNIAARYGWPAEYTAQITGEAIDAILANDADAVLRAEQRFNVEFDWDAA